MKNSKIRAILIILLLSFPLATFALQALPPYYTTANEITTILNHPQVAEKIGAGRPIQSISRSKDGYLIKARECSLNVKIKQLPLSGGMVGPSNIEVIPGELDCEKWDDEDLPSD